MNDMSKKKEIIEKTDVKETASVFSKEQFLLSTKYRQYKDLLNAVLDDNKTYSKEEVNKIINNYYGKVGR